MCVVDEEPAHLPQVQRTGRSGGLRGVIHVPPLLTVKPKILDQLRGARWIPVLGVEVRVSCGALRRIPQGGEAGSQGRSITAETVVSLRHHLGIGVAQRFLDHVRRCSSLLHSFA